MHVRVRVHVVPGHTNEDIRKREDLGHGIPRWHWLRDVGRCCHATVIDVTVGSPRGQQSLAPVSPQICAIHPQGPAAPP